MSDDKIKDCLKAFWAERELKRMKIKETVRRYQNETKLTIQKAEENEKQPAKGKQNFLM